MDREDKQTEESVTATSTTLPGGVTSTTQQTVSPELSPPITEETVTTSSTLSPQEVTRTTKSVTQAGGVTQEHPQKVFQKKKTIFRAYQIIWYLLAVIEILLAFRMALGVVGANPTSGFATLVFALSNPFALPFNGILKTTVSGSSVFDWSILVAAAVYALVAFGIVQLIHMSKPVSKQEVEQAVDEG